jgi:hypothetical protein
MATLLVCATGVEARVVRFVVESRTPFAEGASFGNAGPYERLVGFACHQVDPNDPLNAIITDIDKAPRNARGLVELRTPFFILTPIEMTRGIACSSTCGSRTLRTRQEITD